MAEKRYSGAQVEELINLDRSQLTPDERGTYMHVLTYIATHPKMRARIQRYLEDHPDLKWTHAREAFTILGKAMQGEAQYFIQPKDEKPLAG
jgi:hypothetical protein